MEWSIDDILINATHLNASDIHITVGTPPQCRVHGEIQVMEGYPRVMPDDTKVLASQLIKQQMYQDWLTERGEVDLAYSIPGLSRYRVNIFKQRGSYAMVLRVVNTEIPNPEKLGVPRAVMELTKRKRGLVLVTGPTGSGKSTTLASMINDINTTRAAHIITVEDPIEYLHRHDKSIVNQRELEIDTKSYGNALRAALREDPDVILIGEMRDYDTISTAITAAETGHLVFSTLHTIGAAPTIERVVDAFPAHQQNQVRSQLATVLEGVISQQLMPTVDGKGRVAAFEVMIGTAAVKNLIREDKPHQIPSIMQTSKRLGMQTMDDAIFDHYLRHAISAETAAEFAQDTVAMQQKLF